MSDQLSAAAQAMATPEDLVMRSARARAAATGTDVDAILAAWAGGEAPPAGSAPAAPEPAVSPEPAVEPSPEPTPEPTTPTQAAEAEPAVDAPAAARAVTPVPVPATVTPAEALDHDVVISVPTAGLKERTSTTIPQWLVAALLIVPLFGLLYLAGNGTADATCDEGGVTLRVDRATGALQNCDGSPFEGRGGGSGGSAQFLTLGSELFTTCAGCHGPNGGGGVGPAFGGVLTTFSSCSDHLEWVHLGSAGFQAAGRNTYGDINKPVGGGMPGFANLTDEEIASVVSFERIRFGGGDPTTVLTDCGLLEAAAPADAAAPAGG